MNLSIIASNFFNILMTINTQHESVVLSINFTVTFSKETLTKLQKTNRKENHSKRISLFCISFTINKKEKFVLFSINFTVTFIKSKKANGKENYPKRISFCFVFHLLSTQKRNLYFSQSISL